jgi:hypothetical protein
MAQKFLALERAGNPINKRIAIGSMITYQLKEGQGWTTAEIIDIDAENGLLVLPTRSIYVKDITALRYDKRWSRAVGRGILSFGLSWSILSLIGNYTDNKPNTNYKLSDAIVTASSTVIGLILPKMFRHRTIRLGKKKNLRAIDVTP